MESRWNHISLPYFMQVLRIFWNFSCEKFNILQIKILISFKVILENWVFARFNNIPRKLFLYQCMYASYDVTSLNYCIPALFLERWLHGNASFSSNDHYFSRRQFYIENFFGKYSADRNITNGYINGKFRNCICASR